MSKIKTSMTPINWLRLLVLSLFAMFPVVGWSETVSAGSGFFITADGHFVTNFHVIAGANAILIRDVSGKTFPALVVRVDQANDLAILKVSGSFQPIPIESSSSINIGTGVVAVGFPLVTVQGLEPKVTNGIINSLTGIADDPRLFQISAEVQKGNSGGPLLDMQGNVIGIVSSKLGAAALLKATGDLVQNVNYAIKSNYLLELVRSLPQVQVGLPAKNDKKLEDIAAVYSSIQHSIAIVLAVRKAPPLVPTIRTLPEIQPTPTDTPPTNDRAPLSQEDRLKADSLFTLSRYFSGSYSCKVNSAPANLKGEPLTIDTKGNTSLMSVGKNWWGTIDLSSIKKYEDYFGANADFPDWGVTIFFHADKTGIYKFERYLHAFTPAKEDTFQCSRNK